MNLFIEIKESIVIAYQAITAHKMRSVLATLGIVIGITAVTLMQTAIEGINNAFEKSIAAVGTDVLYVQKFEWFGKEDFEFYRNRKDITMQNYEFVKKYSQTAEVVCPSVGSMQTLQYGNLDLASVFVIGSTDDYQSTLGVNMEDGRFFSAKESEGGYPVVAIQVIKVGSYSFKIVGVIEKQGSMLGLFSLDNRVIIPIEKFFKLYGTKRSLSINIKVRDIKALDEAKEEVSSIMRKTRRVLDGAISFWQSMKRLFFFFAVVTLVVSSMGLFGLILFTTKRRTKEIGIRKAIGARKRTILLQFLIESSIICLLGGVIGLAIAFPISLIIDATVLPTSMPLWVVFLGLIISLIFGVMAGFFPAFNAAKMDPVDSLRYE
ncbi:MAG: ABC transporter permease [Ignavibacteriae bacterium]|nr:ABC transporter permease [Ignavibacteriota bacterium]